MHVLMLLEHPFPPDIRVEKEVQALTQNGYTVFLLCRVKDGQPLQEFVNGMNVHRFDTSQDKNWLRRKLSGLVYLFTLRHPVWLQPILDFVEKQRIDAVHVHDLPLVATAVAVKRKTGIPVVADLHENYPAGLRVWNEGAELPWDKRYLFRNPTRWSRHERRILRRVDHVITVVEEAKERIIGLGISEQKISVVCNTESPSFWETFSLDEEITKDFGGRFIISYIGGFGPHRGLDCAIQAMVRISKEAPESRLLLVGRGQDWYEVKLRNFIAELNLKPYVQFIPWVPMEKVYTYMQITDVGLVPHNSSPHTEATVPHKLFQYMLFSKPVVVSSCRSLKRIVGETTSGLAFQAGDPNDLAEKILDLYRSKDLRIQMGNKGREAAENGKYSWNHSAQALLNVYETVRACPKPG